MNDKELAIEILKLSMERESKRLTLENSNQLSEEIRIELDLYTKIEIFITTHSPKGERDGTVHKPIGRKRLLSLLMA